MSKRDLFGQFCEYLDNRGRVEELDRDRAEIDAKIHEIQKRQTEIAWALRREMGGRSIVTTRSYRQYIVRVDPDSGGLEIEEAMRESDLIGKGLDDRPVVAEAVADHPVDDFTFSELEEVA